MKKNLTIIAAALILVASLAGCGNKTTSSTDNSNNNTDASGAYENAAYSEQVDMDKVEGQEIKSDTDSDLYDGELGNAKLSIGDAKVINYQDEDVVIVSFEYKNTGDADMPFTGAFKVEAYQDDSRLRPTVVDGVEGVEMLAMSENVAKGDEITVQKAYKLRDKSAPVTIEVNEANITENSKEPLTKTFNF